MKLASVRAFFCHLGYGVFFGKRGWGRKITYPTNNALLLNFLLSSDAEIFVSKHRLSIYKSAPSVQTRVRNVYVFQLSFLFAYHRWWLGSYSRQQYRTSTSFL